MGGISGKTISQRQQYVAFPGFSQHHTGHCVDICSTNTDWWDKRPKFNKLVKDNCGKYGIQVTYQAANGGIGPTSGGIRWGEPWHIYIKDYQQNDSKNI
jgi:LAS superfamily LD-carboxypeptidase LdcB